MAQPHPYLHPLASGDLHLARRLANFCCAIPIATLTIKLHSRSRDGLRTLVAYAYERCLDPFRWNMRAACLLVVHAGSGQDFCGRDDQDPFFLSDDIWVISTKGGRISPNFWPDPVW